MNRRAFKHALSAILYIRWRQSVDIWGGFRFFLNSLFTQASLLFGRNKFKALRMHTSIRDEIKDQLANRKGGTAIYHAERWIEVGVLTYGAFIGFILAGLILRIFNPINKMLLVLPLIIISIILEVYLNVSLLWSKRYVAYFRVFDSKDISWHEKWTFISYMFMLGGILAFIMGIGLMFAISCI